MSPFRLKNCYLIIISLTLSANMFSQSETEILLSTTEILPQGFTQIFTDSRDGTKYPLVASEDRFWLNANLNFETPDSDCLNDKEENCKSLGRLYSWEEAQSVCPVNWKLPDQEDFKNLFGRIASEEMGRQSGVLSLPYTWENFNTKNPIRIKLSPNGMKQKKKYIADDSFNIWLRSSGNTDAIHIRGYKNKKDKKELLSIFPHNHEEKKSIKHKNKFGVRCVIPISEFNKLTFGNG